MCKRDRAHAGFFEAGLWEKAKRTEGISQLIGRGMSGTSVTCVCVGYETWSRYWVRYEILKSFADGKGILGVRVHNISSFDHKVDPPGDNPFDYLAFRSERNGVRLMRKFNGIWGTSEAFPTLIPWSAIAYDLGGREYHTFSTLFPLYNWSDDGSDKLGRWIEAAAQQAGR